MLSPTLRPPKTTGNMSNDISATRGDKNFTRYDCDDWFLDDLLADPGGENLLGRFIHFGVADRSQVSGVLAPGTWHKVRREPNKQR